MNCSDIRVRWSKWDDLCECEIMWVRCLVCVRWCLWDEQSEMNKVRWCLWDDPSKTMCVTWTVRDDLCQIILGRWQMVLSCDMCQWYSSINTGTTKPCHKLSLTQIVCHKSSVRNLATNDVTNRLSKLISQSRFIRHKLISHDLHIRYNGLDYACLLLFQDNSR